MRWADSHCHIHDPRLDVDVVLAAAHAVDVGLMVTVGCDEETTLRAIEVARSATSSATSATSSGVVGNVRGEKRPNVPVVWATAGLHPHDATDGLDWMTALLDRATELRIVGVGECGLDYYYEHSPRDVQQRIFAEQIRLAHSYDLPLVIHTRDAWDDTFEILHAEGTPSTTIFHCFSGGPEEAERCLGLHDGVYLSYSGIVTFKTAESLREAARITPMERLLVETDSPYLAPVPHRGKRNEPAFVTLVGAHIADVKEVAVETLAEATWEATTSAFRLSENGEQRAVSQ
jgi:TatD DNase family protein